MKYLVFFNSSNEAGGPARVISLWSNYFINKGFKVEVVANIRTESFFELNNKIKLSFLGIDKFKQKNLIRTFFILLRFIAERKNQYLIFNKAIYIPYLYFFKRLGLINKSLKLIYFIHGGSSDLKIYYNNWKCHMITKTFDKVIALHDDFDNFNTNKRKKIGRMIFDKFFFKNANIKVKNNLVFIPNPISFPKNKKTNKSKIILAVGRLDFVKGFDLLIKAWGEIYSNHLDWKLQIVGSGEEKNNLFKIIKQNDIKNIELIPETKKIERFYSNASIYIMSSREEGWGMVILEAMAFGLPIISFENSGAKKLIENYHTGIFVKLNNVEDLAKTISYMIFNPLKRREISLNCKLEAEKYNISKIEDKWGEIFQN